MESEEHIKARDRQEARRQIISELFDNFESWDEDSVREYARDAFGCYIDASTDGELLDYLNRLREGQHT